MVEYVLLQLPESAWSGGVWPSCIELVWCGMVHCQSGVPRAAQGLRKGPMLWRDVVELPCSTLAT